MEDRISSYIRDYDSQGIHRTGTDVDNRSADWLAKEISDLGVQPQIDEFSFERLEVHSAKLVIGGLSIDAVPLYDCTYTDQAGITGSLGELGRESDIGFVVSLPQASDELMKVRRSGKHKAIVLVTHEQFPGTGPAIQNAENFGNPFGPPVLQVAGKYLSEIKEAAGRHDTATVIAHASYVQAKAKNIGATINGTNPELAPLVIMTPRSGWWRCASERGGGIAAFLEIMRAIKSIRHKRDVVFTANTGHELGHTGLEHYLEKNKDLIRGAMLWIHLGANFAACETPAVRLQYCNEELRAMTLGEADREDLVPARETPFGQRPVGEARNIFDGGGKYISILGGNGLFHHAEDVWPEAVDVSTTARWTRVFTRLAQRLVNS